MYRLLVLQNIYRRNLHNVTSSVFPPWSNCSFCKHGNISLKSSDWQQVGNNIMPVRFQSSGMYRAVQKNGMSVKKKRVKRFKKKYAELLEITEASTSQTKASVSNLKPKHLSMIVEQPDLNLSQLHQLKMTKQKGKQALFSESGPVAPTADVQKDLGRVPERQQAAASGACEETEEQKLGMVDDPESFPDDRSELLQEVELLGALGSVPLDSTKLKSDLFQDLGCSEHTADKEDSPFSTASPLVEGKTHVSQGKSPQKKPKVVVSLKKRLEEAVKVKQTELEALGKEESLFRNLCSYLDVCVNCGMLNRGLATLLYYRSRNKQSLRNPPPSYVKLYATVLHGLARKGNLSKVTEIFGIMHEDALLPSLQCYAAFFECVGRLPASEETTTSLRQLAVQMRERGLDLNDLVVSCSFVSDQREKVIEGIRRIENNFIPIAHPMDISYSCPLVEELNVHKQHSGYISPGLRITSSERMQRLVTAQLQAEMNGFVSVKSVEKRPEPTPNVLRYREKLEETQAEWRKIIAASFTRDLNSLKAQHHSHKMFQQFNVYPYLKALNIEEFVDIILQEIRSLSEGSETFSPTTHQLYRELGTKVKTRYFIKQKKLNGVLKKVEHLYREYCDWYIDPSSDVTSANTREKWQRLLFSHQDGPTVTAEEETWPASAVLGVGKFLYNIIMRDIKVDVNLTRPSSKSQHLLPAFYTLFRHQSRLMKEEVKPHPVLARLFRAAEREDLVFDAVCVPMLTPPVPWTSVGCGGYLLARADLVRLPHQAVQQLQRLRGTPARQLYPALDCLDQLGAVPWTINEPVLDVVLEVFNSGGSSRLDIPEPPSSVPAASAVTPDMSKQERAQLYRQRMAVRRRKAEMYSLWCDALYRLSLAHHYRKKVFWLPHNMDFRGRVYPCAPHLNHLCSDMARSILCFARGEPLGQKGLDWLKIHAINLTGLKKKEPLSERLQYANKMMDEILDSADNPLTGCMWWAESEEPWQTLAACVEIARAVRSGDPARHECRFPVHQDGSCNGLQHYAALGRDTAGARSVNLSPAPCPQDVYSCVAALVERERETDAANGMKVAQVLEGFVRRKVIKQTVMTTVYGVTRFGARLQIVRQLKDIDNFPKDSIWSASSYLVVKTFESLREMFTSTKEIQDWFTECAKYISQVCGQNVEWVTPLGLPVVQPYSRKKQETLRQSKKLPEHSSMDMFERPNVMKQKNAFPPNFIHSLDSCHMMLTSLFCERHGITFVSVHDCFWTHPSTVDVMNKICREQFIALHSQPILEDLSRFLVDKYSYSESEIRNNSSVVDAAKQRVNKVLAQVPRRGDFDVREVLESVYFFS
ncbi:DNA-directed RNA polymerase, mitochondrial [Bacillus rossius redtenbacheri]|uniref:DNA-directed RNA polymerase, mitochondrial n=1 Tax=Bacillus rossius redtenbacheri TaxID=93214 RepID=UPI002FDD4B16